MGQFVVAMLIGGFFSAFVICLQCLFIVAEDASNKVVVKDTKTYDFAVNSPYSANPFRDPKNHPWMFTDNIMLSIVRYFRSELTGYKGTFSKEESNELSYILYDKTYIIENFIRESKRGKFDEELFNQIINASFEADQEEKAFLLRSVFKEAHNTLIDDHIAGKLKC